MLTLKGTPSEREFLHHVIRESGQNLLECLQCGKCSGGCPITSNEVGGPRRLIAEILSGMKEAALGDPTWWYCVSCGTCATRCPVEINMYKVSTVLCEIAGKEDFAPSEPDIHRFEELFLKSVEEHGRVEELQTAMIFNLRSWKPFRDATKGLQLMLKGAISFKDLLPGKKAKQTEAGRIFEKVRRDKDSGAAI
ncbi:MAG: 4Fe-4S dicluster domain-containing protein [Syntrophobacteraceae bacterium]|nr:4Fe-4S dicluster domain-containing protein [Syntrophobacteraceae bacterium]